MRLIIAFDHNFSFESSDIVLSDRKPISLGEARFIKAEVNIEKDYVSEINDFVENYLSHEKDKLLQNVIKSSINNFNRNWILHSFGWVDMMKKVLNKYSISEIIIVGYTKPIGYIPYYEAEGEIGSQLLYKTKDVLPGIICNVLEKENLKFTILNKQNSITLRARVFIRRYGLLFFKLYFFASKSLKSKKQKGPSTKAFKIIMFSRAISHTEFLEKFVRKFYNDTLIHVSNSISSKDANTKYVTGQNLQNAIYDSQYTKLSHVLSAFFSISKSIFKVIIKKRVYLELNGVKINVSSAQIEMLISYFDALIYQKSIADIEFKSDAILVTSEMYSAQAYVVAEVAKQKKLTSIQLQSFAMFLRKEPSFFYSDYFLTNNEHNALELKKIYPEYAHKIKFYGNLSVDETHSTASKQELNLKKVVYFSQPLQNENKEEFSLVNKLLELQNLYGYTLYVKLHPRETQSKYSDFPALKFIKTGLTFSQYINDVDLAVIRTTSIGQQLIINNTPTLFCLLTETAKNAKVDFIDHDFYGTIFNTNAIEHKLNDIKTLQDKFSEYRNQYIQNNNLEVGIDNFYKKINQL